MYGGRVVEAGTVESVLTRPQHRYTQGLVAASDLEVVDRRLPAIPGAVPPAGRFPDGCVFRNRCAHATARCSTRPPWTQDETEGGSSLGAHGHACWHPAGGGADG
jgi:oligopeptide/dipeptide ABC transporter ATP-binding protein